jgi:hypothetical protein
MPLSFTSANADALSFASPSEVRGSVFAGTDCEVLGSLLKSSKQDLFRSIIPKAGLCNHGSVIYCA